MKRIILPLAFIFLFLAFSEQRADAQVAYGISAIQYNPETTIVEAFSITELDYIACYYYDAYVEGYLYEGGLLVDSGAYWGICYAEVDTETFANAGQTYTVISDHYVVAYYYYPEYGYYDPYGFGQFGGGEFGGGYNFNGCYCPSYYYAEFIYLGSTAASITPNPPCTLVPRLLPQNAQVARAGSITFTIDRLCQTRQISNWSFSDGTNVVNRSGSHSSDASWGGKMVVSGTITVTVNQGGHSYPLSASVTVNPRSSFAFTAVPASKNMNGVACQDVAVGSTTVPNPPDLTMHGGAGKAVIVLHSNYTYNAVSDPISGPNQGYRYVTSVVDNTINSPLLRTQFCWVISPDLEAPASDFFRAQCGDYNAQTNPDGFISGAMLRDNIIRHESGATKSHYENYKNAQDDPAKNVGIAGEKVTGPPAQTLEQFMHSVDDALTGKQTLIANATSVEPPCHDNEDVDNACAFEGRANAKPYEPCKPSGLTATAGSSTQVNLTWTVTSFNEDGFKVERSNGGAFAQVGPTLPKGSTNFSDGTVSASTTYTYRVFAVAGTKTSLPSNTASVTTPASGGNLPGSPSNLAAASASSSQINISWVDNSSNETGFKIERRTGSGAYSQIATVGPNLIGYSDTTVAASTSYTYRVRATNGAGDSPYSNEASATTPAPSPPGSPSGLAASALSSTQVNLNWVDNSNNETGFKIERRTGVGAYSQIATVGANSNSYSDTTVAASTTYTYRVRATSGAGDSAYSNEASVTTPAGTGGAPAAPSGLVASAVQNWQVNLSWTDNSSNETGFKIERSSSTEGYSQIGTVGANVTSYIDTTVLSATAYTYRVRAYSGAGDSTYSNAASTTTPPAPPPNPASDLSAVAVSSTQINVSWTDNSSNEYGFHVERSVSGGAFSLLATVGANVTNYVVYVDSAVVAYTTYTYRVRAFNDAGDSVASNWGSATTPQAPGAGPAAPCCLNAYPGASSYGPYVTLIWVDRSSDETGFKVERKSPGGSWSVLFYLGPDNTNLSDNTVAYSTTYVYRVGAYNATGTNYSGEVEVTTPDPQDESILQSMSALSDEARLCGIDRFVIRPAAFIVDGYVQARSKDSKESNPTRQRNIVWEITRLYCRDRLWVFSSAQLRT